MVSGTETGDEGLKEALDMRNTWIGVDKSKEWDKIQRGHRNRIYSHAANNRRDNLVKRIGSHIMYFINGAYTIMDLSGGGTDIQRI